MEGLSLLVQAQVDDLLDGIQPVAGFNAGSKRKKALSKFAAFYFGDDAPELSTGQAQQLLVGDRVGRTRTGLTHLAGLLKRRKEQGAQALTESALLAVEFLDKIVNLRIDLPAAETLRDAFVRLPLEQLALMHLDLHCSQRTRRPAFRLVQAVLRHHRRLRVEDQHVQSETVVLGELLKDDDAHDMYIEWEDDDMENEEDEEDGPAEDAADPEPAEWNHVVMADASDDEDDLAASATKVLLASVTSPTAVLAAPAPLASSLSFKSTGGSGAGGAVANPGDGTVEDPLRVFPGDLRSLQQRPLRALQPGPRLADRPQPPTPPSPPSPPSPPPPPQEQQQLEQQQLERPPSLGSAPALDSASTASQPPSPGGSSRDGDGKSKRKRFRNLFTKRRNRHNSFGGLEVLNRLRTSSQASIQEMQQRVNTPPPPSPSSRSRFSGRSGQLEQLQQEQLQEEERRRYDDAMRIDQRVMSAVMQSAAARPDGDGGTGAVLDAEDGESALRVQKAPSVMPSSDAFSPSLFLWRAHADTSLQDLVVGLRNLKARDEDQRTRMKALVMDNFDRFVHCRNTIGHIESLMAQERRTARPSQQPQQPQQQQQQQQHAGPGSSRTERLGVALDKALETANEHFAPLLQQRKRVRKLRRATDMLRRLEYLWQMPQHLRSLMDKHQWIEAVIEFSNVGQHLALLDDEAAPASDQHRAASFYRDAVKDLENCGADLIQALLQRLKSPLVLTTDSSNIAASTGAALRREDRHGLLCTEALSLLLELRDHVPAKNRLFKMLDEDGDPFVQLAQSQQVHATTALGALEAQVAGADEAALRELLRRAAKLAAEYLFVWEDARVCLDPLSASSDKEHIFDVLNRVKGEAAVSAQLASHEQQLEHRRMMDLADEDEDEAGDTMRARLRRSGSVDMLFDIRKRSAANCSLELLAERRKGSDSMALAALEAFVRVCSMAISRARELGALDACTAFLRRMLRVLRKARARGSLNSALHAHARRTQRDQGAAGDAPPAAADPVSATEALACELVTARLERLVQAVEDCTGGLAEGGKGARAVHHEVPQLGFVRAVLAHVLAGLGDLGALLRNPEALAFWRDGFLKDRAVQTSKALTRCIKALCEGIATASKQAAAPELASLLFADCHYCRTVFISTMEARLQQAIEPRFKLITKDSRETLAQQLQRQLLRLEDALMAQCVAQQSKGLKALLDDAMQADAGPAAELPVPPVALRSYTLEALLLFADIVAQSAPRVGRAGSRQMLCGLTARLGHLARSGLDRNLPALERAGQGLPMQLDCELRFLRAALKPYETDKAAATFAEVSAALSKLHAADAAGERAMQELVDQSLESTRLVRTLAPE